MAKVQYFFCGRKTFLASAIQPALDFVGCIDWDYALVEKDGVTTAWVSTPRDTWACEGEGLNNLGLRFMDEGWADYPEDMKHLAR